MTTAPVLDREVKVDGQGLEDLNIEVTADPGITMADYDPNVFEDVLTALPTNQHGVLHPKFWRYYFPPWTPIFHEYDDPYNDLVTILWGPRGGGKTVSGVAKAIIDGQMRGIPVISNIEFAWVAKDIYGKLYKIQSIPFDVEKFAKGDKSLMFKRLLIDEGNYEVDKMKTASNKNLAMVDILQQARKFKMSVDFCAINWLWLDPRVTGDLLDILIWCNDLYYKPYGRSHGIQKGHRITWDVKDQSGKLSGRQFTHIASTTFNARIMWFTYDTLNFVDPEEARKRLKRHEKTMFDEFGAEVTESQWYSDLAGKISDLARTKQVWPNDQLWPALGLPDRGLRIKAGTFMKNQLGIDKTSDKHGRAYYDLSMLV